MKNLALAPQLETKDAPEDDTDDVVTKALAEMTATVDERLSALETKTANNAPEADAEGFAKLKARLDKIELKAGRPGHVGPAAKPEDTERKAFTNFLRRGENRIAPEDAKALTVANDASAGYLAPEPFGAEIIKLLREQNPIRQYANVIQIAGPEITYPRRLSGTEATWVSETGNRTASDMAFEQVKLAPHELATFVEVSNALLEDNAYNLESELLGDFAEMFAIAEGNAFVSGDGVGKPKGLLTSTEIAEIPTPAASDYALALLQLFHAIPTLYAARGIWCMNRTTLSALRHMKDSTGRFLMIDPLSEGAPSTILGRPVVEMPAMGDLETAEDIPILFGDLSGYRIVDRVGLNVLRDPFTLATNGQVRFHARRRVGADVTHPDRMVRLKNPV